jgi:hypothetical protein
LLQQSNETFDLDTTPQEAQWLDSKQISANDASKHAQTQGLVSRDEEKKGLFFSHKAQLKVRATALYHPTDCNRASVEPYRRCLRLPVLSMWEIASIGLVRLHGPDLGHDFEFAAAGSLMSL